MCIALLCWLSTSFGFYLINFELKYLPGSVFFNVLMSTAAEIVAKPIAYAAITKLGVKYSYFLCFAIALLGAFLILATDGKFESKLVIGGCLFLTKLGISSCFIVNYLSLEKLFPTLFCATAAGICNFAARLATIFAPMIAEVNAPVPNLILLSILFMACAASTLLSVPTAEYLKESMQSMI